MCPWVITIITTMITTRATANELAWISEAELALGRALFERSRIDTPSKGPLLGTCEDCATFGDLYSKGNPNNAERVRLLARPRECIATSNRPLYFTL